ncbi:hypothetical protein EVAR_28781_1 [Eumeta japonica]|uniref:Uncharacterized protein n=1 Tax=Eumeta variegata TaxID=151549 RepID=A0A4C1VFX7_EUMVA|nr:hypothetical protein EVAR_28781_1 [Eumeta japonica]
MSRRRSRPTARFFVFVSKNGQRCIAANGARACSAILKGACVPPKSRRSSLLMDIHTFKGVTSVLPAFEYGIEYVMHESEPPEL